jgi:polyisoprenoid-binding protein YceI
MSKAITFLFKSLVLGSALLNSLAHAQEHYVIDPEHTFSSFEYSHWGLSSQRGRFDRNSGYVDLDSDNKTGNILLEIDASSVSTGTELFDKVMRSGSFFDVEHFQKISFSSTKFIFDHDQLSQIEGNLTIKESTHPVTLEVTQFNCRFMFLYFKKTCGANGYTKILRSDYNMDRFVPFVSDEVTLYFSVEAIKD